MSASPRMVYLPVDAPSLAQLEARVVARFPQAKPARTEDELRLTFGDWTTRIVDFRETWVAVEAAELAARAPAEARDALAAATHRLEIYGSGDADLDDDHANDALLLWEDLIDLPGAVGHDPFDGAIRASAAAPAPAKVATKRVAKQPAATSTATRTPPASAQPKKAQPTRKAQTPRKAKPTKVAPTTKKAPPPRKAQPRKAKPTKVAPTTKAAPNKPPKKARTRKAAKAPNKPPKKAKTRKAAK